jgi:NADPH-dependent ferric siderophore reductase
MQEPPGPPPNLPPRRWATIEKIEHVTGRVTRLHLGGDEMRGFEPGRPGAHVKLILPPPGETRPAIPERYEGRRAIFAEGVIPPTLRTYTPLRFDPNGVLEVELLEHGDGFASNWVRRARVGDAIIVAGPRGGWDVPQDGDWYLVLADETAIPAATQVIGALPPRKRILAFEVVDEGEKRAVTADGEPVRWLYRGPDAGRAGLALEEFAWGLDLPGGRGYAWVACEAGAMRRIRRHLIDDRQLSPERMVTRGYWRLGQADHPDGDYGQD